MSGHPRQGGHSEGELVPASTTIPDSNDTGTQLRRRKEASLRLPPLETGHRDPFECEPPRTSDYGLTPQELRAEIRRCQQMGWQPWEIRARFVNPNTIGAAA